MLGVCSLAGQRTSWGTQVSMLGGLLLTILQDVGKLRLVGVCAEGIFILLLVQRWRVWCCIGRAGGNNPLWHMQVKPIRWVCRKSQASVYGTGLVCAVFELLVPW